MPHKNEDWVFAKKYNNQNAIYSKEITNRELIKKFNSSTEGGKANAEKT